MSDLWRLRDTHATRRYARRHRAISRMPESSGPHAHGRGFPIPRLRTARRQLAPASAHPAGTATDGATHDRDAATVHPGPRPPRSAPDGFVRFTRTPDDHTDVPAVIDLPHPDWEDLGQPDHITVTIQPGDRLNT